MQLKKRMRKYLNTIYLTRDAELINATKYFTDEEYDFIWIHFWSVLHMIDYSRTDYEDVYDSQIRVFSDYVQKLIDYSKRYRVIITADHGIIINERPEYFKAINNTMVQRRIPCEATLRIPLYVVGEKNFITETTKHDDFAELLNTGKITSDEKEIECSYIGGRYIYNTITKSIIDKS